MADFFSYINFFLHFGIPPFARTFMSVDIINNVEKCNVYSSNLQRRGRRVNTCVNINGQLIIGG